MLAIVKGQLFVGMQKWFEEKRTSEETNAFYSHLPEELASQLLKNRINFVSRIDAKYFVACYNVLTELWDTDTFKEIAAYIAFSDLSTVLKFFMKIGTPNLTALNFPHAWRNYFSVGEYKIVSSKSRFLEAVLVGADVYGKGGCDGALSWTREALNYSGAQNNRVEEVECVFRGDKRCRFICQWD